MPLLVFVDTIMSTIIKGKNIIMHITLTILPFTVQKYIGVMQHEICIVLYRYTAALCCMCYTILFMMLIYFYIFLKCTVHYDTTSINTSFAE